ncbi:MAG: hypothetical protein U0529_02690 [Thermoanaerobaculia bacterium]
MVSRAGSAPLPLLRAVLPPAVVLAATTVLAPPAFGVHEGRAVALAVDSGLGPVFPDVVAEAADRLGRPPCSFLLREFADRATGRPLAETLAATGLTAAEYLRSIRFQSGLGRSVCGQPGMLAYTSPGSRAVVVCPHELMGFRTREGTSTVAVVLHEALHSLGLGEDPPSSKEITAAVVSLCGE